MMRSALAAAARRGGRGHAPPRAWKHTFAVDGDVQGLIWQLPTELRATGRQHVHAGATAHYVKNTETQAAKVIKAALESEPDHAINTTLSGGQGVAFAAVLPPREAAEFMLGMARMRAVGCSSLTFDPQLWDVCVDRALPHVPRRVKAGGEGGDANTDGIATAAGTPAPAAGSLRSSMAVEATPEAVAGDKEMSLPENLSKHYTTLLLACSLVPAHDAAVRVLDALEVELDAGRIGSDLPADHCAIIVEATGRLRIGNHGVFERIADRVERQLVVFGESGSGVALSNETIGSEQREVFFPSDLAAVVWGFAAVRYRDEDSFLNVGDFFVKQRIEERAFGTTNFKAPKQSTGENFCRSDITIQHMDVRSNLALMDVPGITKVIASFAAVEVKHPLLIQTVTEELIFRLNRFTAGDLVNTAYAFATLKAYSPEFMLLHSEKAVEYLRNTALPEGAGRVDGGGVDVDAGDTAPANPAARFTSWEILSLVHYYAALASDVDGPGASLFLPQQFFKEAAPHLACLDESQQMIAAGAYRRVGLAVDFLPLAPPEPEVEASEPEAAAAPEENRHTEAAASGTADATPPPADADGEPPAGGDAVAPTAAVAEAGDHGDITEAAAGGEAAADTGAVDPDHRPRPTRKLGRWDVVPKKYREPGAGKKVVKGYTFEGASPEGALAVKDARVVVTEVGATESALMTGASSKNFRKKLVKERKRVVVRARRIPQLPELDAVEMAVAREMFAPDEVVTVDPAAPAAVVPYAGVPERPPRRGPQRMQSPEFLFPQAVHNHVNLGSSKVRVPVGGLRNVEVA